MDESGLPRMRILVVGSAGNLGARIVRAFRADPSIELLVAAIFFVAVTTSCLPTIRTGRGHRPCPGCPSIAA